MNLYVKTLTLTEPTTKKYYSNQRLCKGTWDKTRWRHAINPHIPIPSPIPSGLHLRDAWLGCEGSRVWNADKTSWLLLTFLSSFIHPSLPSHITTPSGLGLKRTTQWSVGHSNTQFMSKIAISESTENSGEKQTKTWCTLLDNTIKCMLESVDCT